MSPREFNAVHLKDIFSQMSISNSNNNKNVNSNNKTNINDIDIIELFYKYIDKVKYINI